MDQEEQNEDGEQGDGQTDLVERRIEYKRISVFAGQGWCTEIFVDRSELDRFAVSQDFPARVIADEGYNRVFSMIFRGFYDHTIGAVVPGRGFSDMSWVEFRTCDQFFGWCSEGERQRIWEVP